MECLLGFSFSQPVLSNKVMEGLMLKTPCNIPYSIQEHATMYGNNDVGDTDDDGNDNGVARMFGKVGHNENEYGQASEASGG